ncbi:MAG TPA: hypothetical protein VIN11_08735, partial [Roseivirga sp.]
MKPSITIGLDGKIVKSSLISIRLFSFFVEKEKTFIDEILVHQPLTNPKKWNVQREIFGCNVILEIEFSNDFYTIFFNSEDYLMANGFPDNEKYKLIV